MRGAPLDDDLTRWEFWWEFGKDPYLRLRDAVDAGRRAVSPEDALLNPRFHDRRRAIERPTEADLQRVADSLARTLQQAADRDTVSACLVALGKIGRDGRDWKLFDSVVPFLARNDQEQRETAALALGIAARGDDESLTLLADLARDADAARRLSGQTAVNERTRAFAAFGLGLQLRELRRPAAAFRTVTGLRALVADRALGWNLRVAAIEALGLFPGDWDGVAPHALRQGIVDELGAFYLAAAGPGEQLVQAHVPPMLGRLLALDDPATARWQQVFATDLARDLDGAVAADPRGKSSPHIAQSCALALGSLCQPWDGDDSADAATCELLWRVHRQHRDQQTRSFALLALARIGGTRVRDRMLAGLPQASAAIELPWYAIALGVWSARRLESGLATGAAVDIDRGVADALRAAFRAARTPAAIGSLGLALGLMQDVESGAAVRSALVQNAHRDDLAGYLALGLGLMGDHDATGEVRALVRASVRRPQVLQQGVRTLGLLGDFTVVDELCQQLQHPEPSLLRLSAVAAALGQIGDRRSLEPLLAMLDDERLTPLTRAFAAVALGTVCDPAPLPWNAAYATTTNYRAATETLTDGAAGILDIL
ncbi:MAG: HEAT repeat domain-containing protein [Planctomycetes bacterium]|nr:HEAT repeat domain-containing protein [Planctomycetota bacterium]